MLGLDRISLKWRIAALVATLLLLFAAVLATIITNVVSNSLEADLKFRLQTLANRAEAAFAKPTPGQSVLGVGRQLESVAISLYRTSDGAFAEGEKLNIPAEVVKSALKEDTYFIGRVEGHPIRAALTRLPIGRVAAISADASNFETVRQTINNTVWLTTLLMAALALGGGYLVALLGMRPLKNLAEQTTRLHEQNLEPLAYNGPRDELGLLATTINQLVARLKRTFEAQKTFLAETSHELRTPLTALEGYISRAAREADAAHKPLLEDAMRVTRGMTRLVSDLLQLSRGDVVNEWIPHVCDLREVARSVGREFPGVHLDLANAPLELIGDPERLAQLVRNLVANAVRACNDPSLVTIRAARVQDHVVLQVADAGPGIPKELQEKIFEKFYKGHGGGAGLGLAIVAQIARVHGGSIRVESEIGKGATFSVTLPALAEDPEDL